MKKAALMLVVLLGLSLALLAQQEKKNVSVSATVDSGTGAIQAKLVPGEFDVPAGLKAVNLRVSKHTTLQGQSSSSDKRSNGDIYCVSTGKYVPASQMELPAGKYKFVVGGEPGSMGTLTYDLVLAK